MIELEPERFEAVRGVLAAEAPCALVPHHPLDGGAGRVFCDDPDAPRWAVLFTGGNLSLAGDAEALAPATLARILEELAADWPTIFIDPPPGFAATVRAARDDLFAWPRVIFDWPAGEVAIEPDAAPGVDVRPLGPRDAERLAALPPDVAWIHDTWAGPRALAGSGFAIGALDADGRLLSVAATFYLGRRFEEIGVVTVGEARGRGLSTACAAALVRDILGRGRVPCWSTTPDNAPSLRVAERLGFRRAREALHFGLGRRVTGALPLEDE